jgi:hypothetical protein
MVLLPSPTSLGDTAPAGVPMPIWIVNDGGGKCTAIRVGGRSIPWATSRTLTLGSGRCRLPLPQ